MSYTPTTWQTGDTITAEKLNNMESGIEGNSVFLITVALNELYVNVADKTYSEIQAAYQSGKTLVCVKDNTRYELARVYSSYFVFACYFQTQTTGQIRINSNNAVAVNYETYYSMPQGGIPQADLAQAVQNKLDPFVVTLTPTEQDFSGTMDKTVAEINAAYEAGQKIVFRVYSGATQFNDVEVTVVYKNESYTYPSFNAYLIVNADSVGFDGIIFAHTEATDNGTQSTYSTTIYPLTPMS